MRVAVVGAGVSGLSAARVLAQTGAAVTVFDKGRSPGGRSSSRFQSGFEFDHGAPFFSLTDERFRDYVELAVRAGSVAPWNIRFTTLEDGRVVGCVTTSGRYVGTPAMGSFARHLGEGIDVRASTRVTSVRRLRRRWELSATAQGDLGQYDALVVSVPPSQVLPLLSESPPLREAVGRVEMIPCWTVLVAFDRTFDVPWHVATVAHGSLEQVVVNRAKPARPDGETWVLYATSAWTQRNIDLPRKDVMVALISDLGIAIGKQPPGIAFVTAHRWRYARPAASLPSPFLWDAEQRLGVCGDWCKGSDIESAFLSGLELAEVMARALC